MKDWVDSSYTLPVMRQKHPSGTEQFSRPNSLWPSLLVSFLHQINQHNMISSALKSSTSLILVSRTALQTYRFSALKRLEVGLLDTPRVEDLYDCEYVSFRIIL